jgi:hypothetical protein
MEKAQLPFKVGTLMRSPDRKPGFSDRNRLSSTGRIRSFRLSDALLYSYCRDLRFVLLTGLCIGFSVWWSIAPEELLAKPEALCSPDFSLIVRVVKDTYLNKVCSTHNVPLPCECGAPLNKAAIHLFTPEESFDPLGLNSKWRSVSFFVASVVLILALA